MTSKTFMPRDFPTKPDDEAEDSPRDDPEGESQGGRRTGEEKAAANREADPPA